MTLRDHPMRRKSSERSRTTSEGMRRSAEKAAKHGVQRGERDADGLTRKDRIVRAVCDATAAGVNVTPELIARLLPLEAETMSPKTFERYVKMGIGGEGNVAKERNWPIASQGYEGDARAHDLRVSVLKKKYVEPEPPRSKRPPTRMIARRQPDPFRRQQVESAAIEVTTEYFKNNGDDVDSVERDNVGWDLEAVRGSVLLRLEVKGLSGPHVVVELTPNEYARMQEHSNSYRLCIVTSALAAPELIVFEHSEHAEAWIDQHGRQLEIDERVAARCSVN